MLYKIVSTKEEEEHQQSHSPSVNTPVQHLCYHSHTELSDHTSNDATEARYCTIVGWLHHLRNTLHPTSAPKSTLNYSIVIV